MPQWIDRKYIGLLSPRLEQFKWLGETTANCRCPICGDSQTNRTKKRGYFLMGDKNQYFYMCHNCNYSSNIGYLIKELDPTLYKEYRLEAFKENKSKNPEPKLMEFKKPVFNKVEDSLLDKMMPRIDSLEDDHLAVKYFVDREIPKDKWKLFYYLDDFTKVENISKSYKDKLKAEPRIIIPIKTMAGILVGLQGRALDDNPLRYVTLKINPDAPLIFGGERLDETKPIHVVEGPFDSLFLPNCIAVAGSALRAVQTNLPKDKLVLIFDNQPRNKEICKIMERSINDGFRVCLWPSDIKEKDINDMILAGMTREELRKTVKGCSYSGLTATLAFQNWKKI